MTVVFLVSLAAVSLYACVGERRLFLATGRKSHGYAALATGALVVFCIVWVGMLTLEDGRLFDWLVLGRSSMIVTTACWLSTAILLFIYGTLTAAFCCLFFTEYEQFNEVSGKLRTGGPRAWSALLRGQLPEGLELSRSRSSVSRGVGVATAVWMLVCVSWLVSYQWSQLHYIPWIRPMLCCSVGALLACALVFLVLSVALTGPRTAQDEDAGEEGEQG